MGLTVHAAWPPGVGEPATATTAASALPSNAAGPPDRGRSPRAALQPTSREALADEGDGGRAHVQGVGDRVVRVAPVAPQQNLDPVPLAERQPAADPPLQVRPLVVRELDHVPPRHRDAPR